MNNNLEFIEKLGFKKIGGLKKGKEFY